LRVVIDANVWISAAINRGPAYRIVELWFERPPFVVVMCPCLLEEVREVLLERPRLRRFIDEDAARFFVDTVAATVDLLPDPTEVTPATRDADDDYLVALGRVGQADYIVSGDADLLEWLGQRPPVVTPAQFERILSGQPAA
jgi:uncharacterized protein